MAPIPDTFTQKGIFDVFMVVVSVRCKNAKDVVQAFDKTGEFSGPAALARGCRNVGLAGRLDGDMDMSLEFRVGIICRVLIEGFETGYAGYPIAASR